MIMTDETVEDLRAKGWVELWRQPVSKLEAAGVPIKLAPKPPGEGDVVWTTSPMAPRWAVELVTDWPGGWGGLDPLLERVIKKAYGRADASMFTTAVLSAYALGGGSAVHVLLESPCDEDS